MKILITVCARGGSKGIPGKNIKPIAQKPLIAYTIETAQRFAKQYGGVVELSTDSEGIRTVAAEYGLSTGYLRPATLASDSAGKIDVLYDLLQYSENRHEARFDYLLDLDVTSPLRTLGDLREALAIIESDSHAWNLFSVNPANRNPYFNMVEKKENGYYHLVKTAGPFLTRQSAPKVYELNASFYFYRRSFFENNFKTAITDRSLIYEMPHTCFDLDHPVDFDFMEYLIVHNKLGFQL